MARFRRWARPSDLVAAGLSARGARTVLVRPAGERGEDADSLRINPDLPGDYAWALSRAQAIEPKLALAGVVSLWPLRVPRLGPDTLPSAVQRFGTQSSLLLLQALAQAGFKPAPGCGSSPPAARRWTARKHLGWNKSVPQR